MMGRWRWAIRSLTTYKLQSNHSFRERERERERGAAEQDNTRAD
jgi:hypothetical protein